MEAGELLKHALTLPDKERAELASSLIDSLDPTVDTDAEIAWQEELLAASKRSKAVGLRQFHGTMSGAKAERC